LPLERKIQISQTRIIEWYKHWGGQVVVSFSGGKDSTVLLHLVRSIFPDVKAVFSNTGLEYPEIQKHVRSIENVDIVTPTMRFDEVISTYGYPLIGKEVAEAIYYARRIKKESSDVKIIGRPPKTGLWGDYHRRCLKPNEDDYRDKECFWNRKGASNSSEQKKTDWHNWRRNCLQKSEQNFGSKSQFNKEKWRPMVYTPFMISHLCCFRMKKTPMKSYQHKSHLKPYLGTLAEESRIRKQAWIRHGCNAFESADPTSQPLSFWTEQDILAYIVKYNLKIADVYGKIVSEVDGAEYPAVDMMGNVGCNLKCTGCQRTGCIFCGFGFHLEKGETRFQRLARTHPKQYEYSIGGGQWVDNPAYDPTAPEMDGEWQNWNPKKIWVPSKKGLGMGKVFDLANEIYGKDFYRYE
jgi:3'-phosphoadenosine 5'-phosphosulfate sulfotransferase (PAPS reductase)/FAD synthetase